MTTPEEVYRELMAMLQEGARRARHPYHLMSIASVDAHGAPQLRTVVLRHVDAALRDICFHTDRRSPKAAMIEANPEVALLFYDPKTKWQVRLNALASLHADDTVAQRQWQRTADSSKVCYLHRFGSGTEVGSAQECGMDARRGPVETTEDNATAYANFAVVRCRFYRLDLVMLHCEGHQRLVFDWDETGSLKTRWVVI